MDKSDLNELKNMLSGLVEEIIDEKLDGMKVTIPSGTRNMNVE